MIIVHLLRIVKVTVKAVVAAVVEAVVVVKVLLMFVQLIIIINRSNMDGT
jgi:hypothetical protein